MSYNYNKSLYAVLELVIKNPVLYFATKWCFKSALNLYTDAGWEALSWKSHFG